MGFAPIVTVVATMRSLAFADVAYAPTDRYAYLQLWSDAHQLELGPSPPLADAIRRGADLESVTAFQHVALPVTVPAAGNVDDWSVVRTDPSIFDTLRVRLHIGSVPAQSASSEGKAVVLSWRGWQRHFAGRANVLGAVIRIGSTELPVRGVLGREITFPDARVDAWLVEPLVSNVGVVDAGSFTGARLVGRLRSGQSALLVQEQIEAMLRRSELYSHIIDNLTLKVRVRPLHTLWLEKGVDALTGMVAASVIVLLLAVANVTGLFIVSQWSRRNEIALCEVLGARRSDHLFRVLCDAGLIAVPASMLSLPLGYLFLRVLIHVGAVPAESGSPAFDPSGMAVIAGVLGLASTALLAVCALLILGLASGHATRLAPRASESVGARRFRMLLASGQIAAATVATYAAVSLSANSARLVSQDFGFDRAALVARLQVDEGSADDPGLRGQLRRLREAVASIPGVSSVVLSSQAPFGETIVIQQYRVPGRHAGGAAAPSAYLVLADEGQIRGIGARLVAGRDFVSGDVGGLRNVAVIDERIADRDFGGDAVGRVIEVSLPDNTVASFEIVGVSDNVRYRALTGKDEHPTIYLPIWAPYRASGIPTDNVEMVLRSGTGPALTQERLISTIRQTAPGLRLAEYRTIDERVRGQMQAILRLRLFMWLVTGFAMVLAAAGTYVAVSATVNANLRDYGVRKSFGATPLVIVKGLLMTTSRFAGLAQLVAIPLALTIGGVLAARVGHAAPPNGTAVALAAAVAFLVSLVATLAPALRAMRMDPAVCLRDS